VVNHPGSLSAPAQLLNNREMCYTLIRGLPSVAKSFGFADEASTCESTEYCGILQNTAMGVSNMVGAWKRHRESEVGGLSDGKQS